MEEFGNLLESVNCNEPLLVVTAVTPMFENEPLMKYLDASTGTRANKIFKRWNDINREFGALKKDMQLLHVAKTLAKRWHGARPSGALDSGQLMLAP